MADSFENMMRQIVREEIQQAFNDLRNELSTSASNDYPHVLSVKEAAKILNIGTTRMYELTHIPSFPAIRTSNNPKAHIKIPREPFLKWINDNANLIA